MAIYPGAIPTNTNYPNRTDDVSWIYAARYNEIKNEVIAICAELGINPKGASADVVTRLALLALKASPVFTGQATIPTINLTGGQIVFPASQAASANPNTLDDYEEGTFVATITCSTSGTITLQAAANTLAYRKIGNLVHVQGRIKVDSVDSPLGEAQINLPFVAATLADTAGYSLEAIGFSAVNYVSTGWCFANAVPGDSYCIVQGTSDDAGVTTEQSGIFAANSIIYFKASFIAA